jgi:uncharacterized protein YjiS (DUF1127 family)
MCIATLSSAHGIHQAAHQIDADCNNRKTTMNIARTYNNWLKYRQTVTELGRMSNRELGDLGINRADIHAVARQAVR